MSDYFLFAAIAAEAEMKGLDKNRKRCISTMVDTVFSKTLNRADLQLLTSKKCFFKVNSCH